MSVSNISHAPFRVVRRSPGRVRVAMAADPARLSALQTIRGVNMVRFSDRTSNALITFDPRCIEEEQILVRLAAPRKRTVRPAASAHRRDDARSARDAGAAVGAVQLPGGWWRAQGSISVDAPQGRCVSTVVDCETYPDWQRYISQVQVLERDRHARAALVRTRAEVAGRPVVHTARYRYPSPCRVVWEEVDSALGAMRGEWRFRRLGDARTRVLYRMEVLLADRVPALLRGPLVEQMRDTLVAQTLDALRVRAMSR